LKKCKKENQKSHRKTPTISTGSRTHSAGSAHSSAGSRTIPQDFKPRGLTSRHFQRQKRLAAKFRNFSTTKVISHFDEARQRGIKWSTIRTTLGTMIGAAVFFPSLRKIVNDPRFKDYLKHVTVNTLSEEVKFPTALTAEHARKACTQFKSENHLEALALFSTCWATGARISDTLHIHRNRISFQDAVTATVTLTEGKGVKARGQPYTLKFINPFLSAVRVLKQRNSSTYLFDPKSWEKLRQQVRTKLRTLNPTYELRSIRRGSLQHMATAGIALKVLQTISGHTSKQTLLRYLNWGTFATETLNEQVKASNLLW